MQVNYKTQYQYLQQESVWYTAVEWQWLWSSTV